MRNFIGYPDSEKLEAVEGDPGTGLYCYRYDDESMSNKDIAQILSVTGTILGTLENTTLIFEPIGSEMAKVQLNVKHRTNIFLGVKDLTKR